MKVCTYDNPATMVRELWQDGKMLGHYSAQVLPPFAIRQPPGEHFSFAANVGPWESGRIVGDADAIGTRAHYSTT